MQPESQASAAVQNPNQLWFPHILQVKKPEEMNLKSKIKWNQQTVIVDMINDKPPDPGTVVNSNIGQEMIVIGIIDSRVAKGDWSNPFWQGVKPTWFRLNCEWRDKQK